MFHVHSSLLPTFIHSSTLAQSSALVSAVKPSSASARSVSIDAIHAPARNVIGFPSWCEANSESASCRSVSKSV